MTAIHGGSLELSKLPLVCICIPTYNAAKTVRETLESILTQTYKNIVVHISDNASTDETLDVVESIFDSRVIVHRNDINVGGEGNFTRCIELATGKYTAVFHADDVYEPSMVAKQVNFLEENSEVGSVFTEALTIDAQGLPFGVIGRVPGHNKGITRLVFLKLFKIMLKHHNFLVCPSVMVRTEIYKNEIGAWGSSMFKSASDVDTWLRLANKHQIAVLDEQLMRYRISREQFSHINRNRTERADFFLVMDHYLAKPEVCNCLTKSDFRNYRWLERHDRVARSINLYMLGRVSESKQLLDGLFCFDSICSAMFSRRGLVTFLGGTLLQMLLIFARPDVGLKIIYFMKKIPWR